MREGDAFVFIESLRQDPFKYEVDSSSGLLILDQPYQTSSLLPCAYGFMPRTLCGASVARLAYGKIGDNQPLDVFVLSDIPINAHGVLARVRLVGGIPTSEDHQTDDKLIAVLKRDPAFGAIEDVSGLPIHVIDRISHYLANAGFNSAITVGDSFGAERAMRILNAARDGL